MGDKQIKRLYRSKREKVFTGVCGGVAEFMDIDPVAVRLLAVISTLFFGFGLLMYFAAVFIVPENPYQKENEKSTKRFESGNWNFLIGALLVVFGALIMLDQLDLLERGWFKFRIFPWRLIWPSILIALGIYFVTSGKTIKQDIEQIKDKTGNDRRLYRSSSEKKVAGVCGGLAEYFNMDPTIVRLITAFAIFFSGGLVLVAYAIMALIVPEGQNSTSDAQAKSSNGS